MGKTYRHEAEYPYTPDHGATDTPEPYDWTGPLCEWFVGCCRPATKTVPHPILGEVSTCDECHDFATS